MKKIESIIFEITTGSVNMSIKNIDRIDVDKTKIQETDLFIFKLFERLVT
jgi:hypothetical protein